MLHPCPGGISIHVLPAVHVNGLARDETRRWGREVHASFRDFIHLAHAPGRDVLDPAGNPFVARTVLRPISFCIYVPRHDRIGGNVSHSMAFPSI
jgi:hypothetical protein